jgi:hypothetical protein
MQIKVAVQSRSMKGSLVHQAVALGNKLAQKNEGARGVLPSLPLPLSGAACTSTLHMGHVLFLSSHSPIHESQNTWLQGSLSAAPGSQGEKHTGQVHPGSSLMGAPTVPPPDRAPFPLTHSSLAAFPADVAFNVK